MFAGALQNRQEKQDCFAVIYLACAVCALMPIFEGDNASCIRNVLRRDGKCVMRELCARRANNPAPCCSCDQPQEVSRTGPLKIDTGSGGGSAVFRSKPHTASFLLLRSVITSEALNGISPLTKR